MQRPGKYGRVGSAALVSLAIAAMLPVHADPVNAIETRALYRDEAENIALRDNHDIALARLTVATAAAAVESARAAPNPTLTLQTSGINPRLGIGSGDFRSKTVDTSVRIDQLFERGGKRALRSQSAALSNQAARFDLADTTRQIRQAVRQAYYDLMGANAKVLLSQQTAALYASTVDAARKRYRAGDLAASDVARFSVDALRATNDVLQANAELIRARRMLATLMGHPELAETIVLAGSWPPVEPAPVAAVESLVNTRADVRAAMLRVQSAERSWKLALAARTRDISIGVQADHYPTSAANQQGAGNSFAISLQIPLFVRYDFNGEIRAADIALAAARETYQKTQDSARSDLLRMLEEWQLAAQRLTRYQDELLPAAERSAASAEFAFTHGAIGIMDVLDVRRTLRLTQLEALAARAEFAKASTVCLHDDDEATPQ